MKILKNKKGFTLVELLAVIVVLAVIMLIASSNVFGMIANARRGSFRNEFISLLQSANVKAQLDMMNGELKGASSKCYTIENLKDEWKNTNGYVGSVLVTKAADGTLTFKGWMSSSEFIISNKDTNLKNDDTDIAPAGGVVASTNCGK